MNLTKKGTLSVLALGALPLTFAFQPAQDKIDLSLRFEPGQVFTITQSVEFSGDIEDVSVTVDGNEMMEGGVEGEAESMLTMTLVETIKEVRDGEISKMHVKMEDGNMEMSGSINMAGEGEDMDESMPNPAVGHTAEITIDEDGVVERKDITEDAEALSSAELAAIPHNNHFSIFLPSEPVAEGVAFELEPDWEELMGDMMANMDSADMPEDQAQMMEEVMGVLADATELEATGKITKIEEGVATIEYTVTGTTSIDDLMQMIQDIAGDQLPGEIPPANASLEISLEMTGAILFNLEMGQITNVDMEGEVALDMSGDMDMGQVIEAAAAMSGNFAISATIEMD